MATPAIRAGTRCALAWPVNASRRRRSTGPSLQPRSDPVQRPPIGAAGQPPGPAAARGSQERTSQVFSTSAATFNRRGDWRTRARPRRIDTVPASRSSHRAAAPDPSDEGAVARRRLDRGVERRHRGAARPREPGGAPRRPARHRRGDVPLLAPRHPCPGWLRAKAAIRHPVVLARRDPQPSPRARQRAVRPHRGADRERARGREHVLRGAIPGPRPYLHRRCPPARRPTATTRSRRSAGPSPERTGRLRIHRARLKRTTGCPAGPMSATTGDPRAAGCGRLSSGSVVTSSVRPDPIVGAGTPGLSGGSAPRFRRPERLRRWSGPSLLQGSPR